MDRLVEKIETERLVLRQLNMGDIKDVVEGLNNINVSKWLTKVPFPYTEEDAKAYIKNTIDNNLYNYAIVLKSENKLIGGTQITIVSANDGVATGGLWLNEKYHGCGYGTEALDARARYSFEVLGLRRIENGYFKGNEKSHRMQLKVGYKDEGIKRQRYICDATGEIVDECITGLLRDEWMERQSYKMNGD